MSVGALAENVTVTGASPLIETATVSVGQVMAQRTVQEIPLNGRHFVDLGPLMPGGVTPPQNAVLSAPLRGQGSFSFFSAGNRETSVNFMINGVNLNDLSNSQITFQPSINTVSEFKVDNSTFSAEYGRNSGAIVNVATRSGANAMHGEGSSSTATTRSTRGTSSTPSRTRSRRSTASSSASISAGRSRRTRRSSSSATKGCGTRQGVDLNAGVLTDAQRAAVTDPVVEKPADVHPARQHDRCQRAGAAAGVRHRAGQHRSVHASTCATRSAPNDDLHGYYAFQRDLRREPNAAGQHRAGFRRHARRQAPGHDA